MQSIADLSNRFGSDGVRFEAGNGGLTKVVLSNPGADVEVYLHGAHVTSYRPRATGEAFFLSGKSFFAADKPIRGGVPVIFPWFGPRQDDPKAAMHGFARLMDWDVLNFDRDGAAMVLILGLSSNDRTRGLWPHDFALRYTVRVADSLDMALEVKNTSRTEFRFEEALHTYFRVADATTVTVTGLSGVQYLDKTDNMKRKTQADEPISIAAETDRLYLNTRAACEILDPASHRRVQVGKTGSDSTVVWNPWTAKAKAMADFGDDEWRQMVCVETANASENAVALAPGATHVMRQTVRVIQER